MFTLTAFLRHLLHRLRRRRRRRRREGERPNATSFLRRLASFLPPQVAWDDPKRSVALSSLRLSSNRQHGQQLPGTEGASQRSSLAAAPLLLLPLRLLSPRPPRLALGLLLRRPSGPCPSHGPLRQKRRPEGSSPASSRRLLLLLLRGGLRWTCQRQRLRAADASARRRARSEKTKNKREEKPGAEAPRARRRRRCPRRTPPPPRRAPPRPPWRAP